jgi:hypothetical protein
MLCTSRTRGTPRFADLGLSDTSNCAQLVVEIVEKAKGMFIWVFPVKSNVLDQRRRLRLIPADLMDYFNRWWEHWTPFIFPGRASFPNSLEYTSSALPDDAFFNPADKGLALAFLKSC